MKVQLQQDHARGCGWRNVTSIQCQHAHVKAVPDLFWRAAGGWKIHRIRSAIIFLNETPPRFCPKWWCANGSHRAIPVRPGCEEGLSPCEPCDRNWQKAGSP